jgi:hypothetical protein
VEFKLVVSLPLEEVKETQLPTLTEEEELELQELMNDGCE